MTYTTFMRNRCFICNLPCAGDLCHVHRKEYLWDSAIKGFRHKKRLAGSRYVAGEFHKNEIKLTKILENHYGSDQVVTSFHPLWAITKKDVLYEFDIFVKSIDTLIEYNGIQHYQYTPFFHKNKKAFKEQQSRDKRKRRLAKKYRYKVITFKYDEPIFKDYVLSKMKD